MTWSPPLVEQLNQALADLGVELKRGQIIDATFVPVPLQRNSREDNALIKQDAVPIDWAKSPAKRAQKDINVHIVPLLLTQAIILFQDISLVYVSALAGFFGAAYKVGDPKTNLSKLRAPFGMVFQNFEHFPHMGVTENLPIAQTKVISRSKEQAQEKGMKLLERVGFKAPANKFPSSSPAASNSAWRLPGRWRLTQKWSMKCSMS